MNPAEPKRKEVLLQPVGDNATVNMANPEPSHLPTLTKEIASPRRCSGMIDEMYEIKHGVMIDSDTPSKIRNVTNVCRSITRGAQGCQRQLVVGLKFRGHSMWPRTSGHATKGCHHRENSY